MSPKKATAGKGGSKTNTASRRRTNSPDPPNPKPPEDAKPPEDSKPARTESDPVDDHVRSDQRTSGVDNLNLTKPGEERAAASVRSLPRGSAKSPQKGSGKSSGKVGGPSGKKPSRPAADPPDGGPGGGSLLGIGDYLMALNDGWIEAESFLAAPRAQVQFIANLSDQCAADYLGEVQHSNLAMLSAAVMMWAIPRFSAWMGLRRAALQKGPSREATAPREKGPQPPPPPPPQNPGDDYMAVIQKGYAG